MESRFALATASALAAFAFAFAPDPVRAAAPDSVTLRYKFVPGEVLRYKRTMEIAGGSSRARMVSSLSETVTDLVQSVDPGTGNATLQVRESDVKSSGTINGHPFPVDNPDMAAAAGQTTTIVITPLGEPVSLSTDAAASEQPTVPNKPRSAGATGESFSIETVSIIPETGGMGGSGLGQGSPLPSHPVQVGDVWRSSVHRTQMESGSDYEKQSLTALSETGGRLIATLADGYSMTATPTNQPGVVEETTVSTSTGREQFDVTAGTLLSSTSVVTMLTKEPPGSRTAALGSSTMKTTTYMRLVQQTMPQSAGHVQPTSAP